MSPVFYDVPKRLKKEGRRKIKEISFNKEQNKTVNSMYKSVSRTIYVGTSQ